MTLNLTPELVIMVVFWGLAALGAIGGVAAIVETIRAGGKRY